MRNTLLVWLALTAAALSVHFALTRSQAVPIFYLIASGFTIRALDRRARRRLARAAGITDFAARV